jgi:2-polyprenyl-3-methyl-5-hydroxy-6-metoxy-1,4-benzoquinol methylase
MENALENPVFQTKYSNAGGIAKRLLGGYFDALGQLVASVQVESVLEAGCGEGISTQRLRQMLPGAAKMTAFDYDADRLAAARSRNPDISISRETIYELPYADKSFDMVICMEVLEHLEHPDRALAELARVAGRWLLLSVPREPLWRVLNLVRLKYIGGLGNTPAHIQHWSAGGFVSMVRQYAEIRQVRRPIPWTMVLAEMPNR